MELMTGFRLLFAKATVYWDEIKKNVLHGLKTRYWSFATLQMAMKVYPFFRSTRVVRERGKVWARNQREVLGRDSCQSYSEMRRRAQILEDAIYHNNPQLMTMVTACSAKLQSACDAVNQEGHVPVLAPLHICSDMVAGVVAAMVAPYRSYVISVYDNNHFGPDEAHKLTQHGLTLIQHHPDGPPSRLRRMLYELRAQQASVIVFPDILPQYTDRRLGLAMRTRITTLFARPARLHCGTGELRRMIGGRVIPFYIYWRHNQLGIRIFPACSDDGAMDSCFELALRECGEQWLLWQYPSIFYFNARRST